MTIGSTSDRQRSGVLQPPRTDGPSEPPPRLYHFAARDTMEGQAGSAMQLKRETARRRWVCWPGRLITGMGIHCHLKGARDLGLASGPLGPRLRKARESDPSAQDQGLISVPIPEVGEALEVPPDPPPRSPLFPPSLPPSPSPFPTALLPILFSSQLFLPSLFPPQLSTRPSPSPQQCILQHPPSVTHAHEHVILNRYQKASPARVAMESGTDNRGQPPPPSRALEIYTRSPSRESLEAPAPAALSRHRGPSDASSSVGRRSAPAGGCGGALRPMTNAAIRSAPRAWGRQPAQGSPRCSKGEYYCKRAHLAADSDGAGAGLPTPRGRRPNSHTEPNTATQAPPEPATTCPLPHFATRPPQTRPRSPRGRAASPLAGCKRPRRQKGAEIRCGRAREPSRTSAKEDGRMRIRAGLGLQVHRVHQLQRKLRLCLPLGFPPAAALGEPRPGGRNARCDNYGVRQRSTAASPRPSASDRSEGRLVLGRRPHPATTPPRDLAQGFLCSRGSERTSGRHCCALTFASRRPPATGPQARPPKGHKNGDLTQRPLCLALSDIRFRFEQSPFGSFREALSPASRRNLKCCRSPRGGCADAGRRIPLRARRDCGAGTCGSHVDALRKGHGRLNLAFGRAGEGVEGGIMVVLVLWAGLLLI
ncbi:hypothetical protein C7M84_023224 [Penaeus vannamei]|uniref:Uncharacterized protein n=1 Tax=Penaeus vannamei TaxID=6689 RepID=A0A3R7PV84_PENVA|nr:hypothetical protein C7M84_023224 [Penaeus vannamei]